jgi:hypothetical protein
VPGSFFKTTALKDIIFHFITTMLVFVYPRVASLNLELNSVSLERDSLMMGYGEARILRVSVDPEWSYDMVDLTWGSSDARNVIVDQDGFLYAVGHGSATITVAASTADTTCIDSCFVLVYPVPVRIQDAGFRSYCMSFADSNADYMLTSDELAVIERISLSDKGIKSLEGLQYFTALESLVCYNNSLTSLDVSGNPALKMILCANNELTKLDLSHNPALEYIDCTNNKLENLNVNNNSGLLLVICANNELTNLDVSRNVRLEYLDCSKNHIKGLDVTGNRALTVLNCSDNELASLNLDNNSKLLMLGCGFNRLTELYVRGNVLLENLNCQSNMLDFLDLSRNTSLLRLHCANNQLTSLDLSAQPGSQCQYLDCTNNPWLFELWLRKGQDTSLFSMDEHTQVRYR